MTGRLAVALLLLVALFVVCWAWPRTNGNDPQIVLRDGPLSAEVHDNGRLAKTGSVPGDSAVVEVVDKVLRDKRGKWRSSDVAYASVILVRGPSLKLNFQKGRVIANTKDATGHPVQMESILTDAEFERISKSVAESMR